MKFGPSRRRALCAVVLGNGLGKALHWLPAVAMVTCASAQAQSWPAKPVRMVVPVSAGGATDQLARVVAEALTRNLGQQFFVDVKPGAAGAIASIEVAHAPADGYTLLVATSSTHAVAPALSTKLRYNPVDDFTPIGLIAEANNVVLASPALNVKNVQELIALAKQKPGYVNFASSGIGSFGHLTFELLKAQAGISLTHIPYKGTASSYTDMVSGSVHLAADAVTSAIPYVKDGRLRALAVTGPRRASVAPDIPTVAESGVPGFSVVSWFGLYAPRGLPPEQVRRINGELNKVLNSPDVKARFAAWGIDPGQGSATEFAKLVATDTARWHRLATENNIRLD
ncbi:Bug family tripartite tricarboxylate transporter substrate binding protein [Azohydromonas australica]|uniref:Bug family tripartite tricarboxylate transporter substrate binding protein n=1 Tax=Azohydromonas australica TaxID=364039 RepID=UPI00041999B5|nr:tripartite tricarboxylate transporter substrate binding protein [Azohydromonas australica]